MKLQIRSRSVGLRSCPIKLLKIVAAVLCLIGSLSELNAQQLPNVVILYADDMGYGDLACQNPQSKIPTPNLDRLASQGMRLTNAHSSSGVCTPSRYALLEGRYHWRKFHGIVNSFDQSVLDDEKTTLAELLKSKGYATACIGKWHLGWDWNAIKKPGAKPAEGKGGQNMGFAPNDFEWSRRIPDGPLDHGFDYYFGDDVPNFPPYAWFENDRVITIPDVPLATPKKTAEGNWEARPGPSVKDWDFWAVMPKLTEKYVEWIDEQSSDKPFFLYCPFTSPHAPIIPTEQFTGKSQAGGFGDYMFQTDDTVGKILSALQRKGFDKNTIVIFSSDNGPETYAYERVKKYEHRSMGPLRGLKRDLYEGGHRVPMIVRWPGHVEAGSTHDGLFSQIDLYATLAAIVGAQIPAGSAEDSYNQLQMLSGKPSNRSQLVHNTNANGFAIRQDDWVLIEAKSGYVSKSPPWYEEQQGYVDNEHPAELYNLREDLAQRNNLFAKEPHRVAELKKALAEIRAKGQVR